MHNFEDLLIMALVVLNIDEDSTITRQNHLRYEIYDVKLVWYFRFFWREAK